MGDIGLDKWISKMEDHRKKKHEVVIRAVDYREDFVTGNRRKATSES